MRTVSFNERVSVKYTYSPEEYNRIPLPQRRIIQEAKIQTDIIESDVLSVPQELYNAFAGWFLADKTVGKEVIRV